MCSEPKHLKLLVIKESGDFRSWWGRTSPPLELVGLWRKSWLCAAIHGFNAFTTGHHLVPDVLQTLLGGVIMPGGLLLLRGRALETNMTSGMKSASQLLQSKLPESPPRRRDQARCGVRLHNGILGNLTCTCWTTWHYINVNCFFVGFLACLRLPDYLESYSINFGRTLE